MTESELRRQLATVCRMLAVQGLIGLFGHVSLRVAGTDRVLMTPGAGSDKRRVGPDDLFVFDVNGPILTHPGGPTPLEWRIHTQIHRDRPEALCIAHLHAPYATLLGIAHQEIQPVFMHGGFLHSGVPTYPSAQLVADDASAAALSASLGQHVAVAMQGHGVVVAAESAQRAFFYCTFLEENARQQVQAAALGGAVPLSPAEAQACAAATLNERMFGLLWAYFERQAPAL